VSSNRIGQREAIIKRYARSRKTRNSNYFFLATAILICLLSTEPVLGDVPSIQNIRTVTEGEKVVIIVEIRHNDPSSTHYVDIVDIDIDYPPPVHAALLRDIKVSRQTEATFTYQRVIDADPRYEAIAVRARCSTHGWSEWVDMEGQPEPAFYETPLGMAVIGGSIIAFVVVVLAVLKRSGRL